MLSIFDKTAADSAGAMQVCVHAMDMYGESLMCAVVMQGCAGGAPGMLDARHPWSMAHVPYSPKRRSGTICWRDGSGLAGAARLVILHQGMAWVPAYPISITQKKCRSCTPLS